MLETASYIGKKIGKYRIIAELSSHALNSVFQAEYAKSMTAIKIMSKPLTTIKERERFFQEVRLLNMLKYPHILPLLDVGIYDDLPYVVTEYMPNGSLRDYFDEQSSLLVPLQETMYILLQIGQALNYAHQRNIIHGNLKPENILFNEQGRALLTDFRIESMFGKTGYEQSYKSNTYPYMAPEQFKGVPGKATDQYALGCIAYEAFTGKVPFTAADYKAMARKHAHEFPIVPTQHNLLLPGRSEEAILKALAKQSANRYKTIKDLLQALSASITFRANMSASTPATPSTQSTQPDLAAQLSKPLSPASGEVPRIERARLKSNRLRPIAANLSTTSAYAIPSVKVESGKSSQMKVHREQQKRAATPQTTDESRRRVTAIIPPTVNRPVTTRRVPLYKRAWLIVIAACLIIMSALFSAYLLASFHTLKGANQVAHFQPTTVSSQLPTPVPTTVPTVQAFPTPRPTIVPPPTPVPSPTPVVFPTPPSMPPTPTPTSTPAPSPTPVAMLTVTPTVLSPLRNCAATRLGFRCTIRLSLSQNFSGTLAWSASSRGVFAIFRPQHGQLLPGASVQVVLHIYNGCPGTGSFLFSTPIGNVSVAWNC